MVTLVPEIPDVGVNPLITGVAIGMINETGEYAVPPGVETEIAPVVAPLGTVAVICAPLFRVKVVATPLNLTDVVPVKLVPVIVTLDPVVPLAGVNPLILGIAGTMTEKAPEEVTVPPAVVTEIDPDVAPLGTVAEICVALFTEKVGVATKLNPTLVAPKRFVPVIVTIVPEGPEVGEKPLMLGKGGIVMEKALEEAALPQGVVTETVPVVAPLGTVAEI